jgi:hypothetical protein
MSNPTIKIHNTETNQVIERQMTDTEVLELSPGILIDGD